ncbi:MAG: Mu transposase C-terminal domain-containing protein, partial [Devosia sp.]
GNVLRIGSKPPVDYNPAKDATITLSQLRLFITKAIVDVHHIGIEPDTYQRRIDLWNDAVGRNPPRPVRDHESILELVGAYDTRKAERRGIRIFGLRYNSSKLATYRSGFEKDPRVEIRYDPQDIGEIYVIDEDKGMSFSVPCTRLDYAAGLSLHQHKVTQRRAKEVAGFGRLRMAELLLAKAELLELGRSMMKGVKTRRTSSRVAHFLGIGHELLKDMGTRREDDNASAEPIDLEDDIEDPVDDAQARLDELEVDRIGREGLTAVVALPTPPAPPVVIGGSETETSTPATPPRGASNIHVSIDDED